MTASRQPSAGSTRLRRRGKLGKLFLHSCALDLDKLLSPLDVFHELAHVCKGIVLYTRYVGAGVGVRPCMTILSVILQQEPVQAVLCQSLLLMLCQGHDISVYEPASPCQTG